MPRWNCIETNLKYRGNVVSSGTYTILNFIKIL